jgi:hypothetical protein
MSMTTEWSIADTLALTTQAKAAGVDCTSPAFRSFRIDAEKHRQQHGNLLGWTYSYSGSSTAQAIYRESFKAKAKIDREALALARAAGYKPRCVSESEVRAVIRTSLELADAHPRPNGRTIIRGIAKENGHDEQWIESVARKPAKRHVAKALVALADHPALQAIRVENMLQAVDKREIQSATLASTVSGIYRRCDIVNRLRALEARAASAEAKANAAMNEATRANTRLDFVEAGEDWHEVARRMRAEGKGYEKIAQATGRTKSGVQSFFRREQSAL